MGNYAVFRPAGPCGTGRERMGRSYPPRARLMRSPILRYAMAVACLGVSGCALQSNASGGTAFNPGPANTLDAGSPTEVVLSSDADASETALGISTLPQAPQYFGSPLCNAGGPTSVCYPDNLATDPTTAQNCHTSPDGGAYDPDGGYADAGLACRVSGSDAGPQPQCSTAGPNQDGASCHLSTDCALGDDCVGNPGICRHYCCSGSGPCAASQFCDIRPKAEDPDTLVPVCIPLRPCGLIDEWSDAGACPAMETCAVARDETGATSCVPIGDAAEGESCKTDHCAAGLVCLGGMTCYKLCHTAVPSECSTNQTCRAALPLFPNPLVGVCESATDASY
jgi:hypothetical protein